MLNYYWRFYFIANIFAHSYILARRAKMLAKKI